jgi:glycine dehydrogenase subunit 2
LSPKAGAHGELCGLLAIRAAHEARGDARKRVLVPTSAHGTNPATAAFVGYAVEEIAQTRDGRVDLADLAARLGPDVAAIMVTNPNTCGLFERDIIEIAGGGGPGAGPVVLSAALAPYAPAPWVTHGEDGFDLVEHAEGSASFGRLSAFHGQMGMYVRALTYMLSHGADGLRQVAQDAVLNANYIKARLSPVLSAPFDGPCMHEALFDDTWLEGTGVSTLDLAKAMIDEGFHPMTMYFPLVVHGAMLIEPTETESRAELDRFCDVVLALAAAAKAGDVERFKGAPFHAPLRRLDETLAARKPRLRWTPAVGAIAAE